MGHTLFWCGEFAPPARILSKRLLSTIRSGIAHWPSPTESKLACLPEALRPILFGTWATQTGRLEAMQKALSIGAELTHPWTVAMINVFAA